MNDQKKVFLHSLHWFRAIAIIFVVLAHAVVKIRSEDVYSATLAAFVQNGTFFFVFIAGYLFWHLSDRFQYKKYLTTKLKYVVLPYVIILSCTLIIAFIGLQKGITLGNLPYKVDLINVFEPLSGVLWHFWVGGAIIIPFWFLPFIILVFITAPLIFKISHSKYFYIVAAFLICTSLLTHRAGIIENPLLFPLLNYVHFIGVFFLGILIKKQETYFYNQSHLLVLVFFVLFIALQTLYIQIRVFELDLSVLINLAQLKMLAGALFFISLLFYIEKYLRKKNNGAINEGFTFKSFDLLAKYSFGIFFIHTFVLKLMEIILIQSIGGINGIFSFLILIAGTFSISIFLVFLIKKGFKEKSRLLVGS